MTDAKGPVVIDLDDDSPSPADAAPVTEIAPPEGRAMQTVATLATRRPSALAMWFWRLLLAIVTFVISVSAWNFVTGLIAQNPALGAVASALLLAFLTILTLIAFREVAALSRLQRIDGLQSQAEQAIASQDLGAAKAAADRVARLYAGREDLKWARQRYAERMAEQMDADAVLGLAERELLVPIDAQAVLEVEAAARQVATVTALVPLALADVVAALTANLRMIRRIAEIYGGRGGTLSSWRLTRAVFAHLVATGAVAVGDDLIGSVAGGGVLAKVSRRFGEGVINGALTARVGVAAIEVCRPLPFLVADRPRITALVRRALAGLFGGLGDKTSAN
ncbi:MAG: TIGR01620 family protein [Pseudomonadota bacterium]